MAFLLATLSPLTLPGRALLGTWLPVCHCEVFINGLTQDDVDEMGCTKNMTQGPQGANRTFCQKPRPNFIPMVNKGCPSDYQPCKVAYKQIPDPYPFCACKEYINTASATSANLCQMNYNPPPPPPPPPPSYPKHRALSTADTTTMVEASTAAHGREMATKAKPIYSAYPLTEAASCYSPNPNQVPSKVGILHDLGCPDNMFFCQAPKTIADLALATPALSTLVELLVLTDLVPLFTDAAAGPYTVLAPTNEAFATVPNLEDLKTPEQRNNLVNLLKYHVLSPAIEKAAAFADEKRFKTLAEDGCPVVGRKEDGFNEVNQAKIVIPDIIATNGIVQVIDGVLKCGGGI